MRKFLIAGVLLFAVAIRPASASSLDISSISGIWINPVGGLNITGTGTNNMTWGDGIVPDSGYTFAASGDISGVPLATPFVLGMFTHHNEPIPSGSSITSVDLSFAFLTNGLPPSAGAVFNFAHNETPNTTGTSPADDDIVTITTPFVNLAITVGSETFFFNLIGFSQDGGSSFTSVYRSPEGGSNSTSLYGVITEQRLTSAPEPASLILLGSGVAGLVARRRARRARP